MKDSFWFDVHYIDLKLSVGLMDCLMREAEDVIRASQIEFSQNSLEYHVAEYDDDHPDDEYYSYKNYYSRFEDDIEKMYKETLPNLMRRSVFLTIYGLLEFNTSLFCESKITTMQFPFELKELKGTGMERCKLFLEKMIGLKHSENIKTLTEMGMLRNFCIHNDGVINNNKQKNISQLIRLSNGTLSINNDTIIFNEGSIKFLIEIIKQFFNEIESALKKQTAQEKIANDGSR